MAYIGVSPSNGVRRVHTYTATASQTTFSGAGAEGTSLSYKDSNFVDVYQNGIKLGDADYTSTSGTSIVLAQGASVDDLVVVVVFDVFSVADTVSKADGGTFDGGVTVSGDLTIPDKIIHDGDTNTAIRFVDADTVSFETGGSERARINNDGKLLIGTTSSMDLGFGSQQLSVRTTGGTSPVIFGSTHDTTTTLIAYASGSSYAGIVQDIRIGRAVSNAYGALVVKANASSSVDTIFYLRGDGNAYADNNWNSGGADYAEYFEWSDGNSDNEDRRGYTVVLDGDKIRKSTSEDNATTIIGVISDNPSVVGNNAWDSWSDKYQKDDYASYILNENGERIINKDFDNTQKYVSRENRPEWDIVGLMGRIRVRVGQTIGDRWIKMREISDTVHEYLVR